MSGIKISGDDFDVNGAGVVNYPAGVTEEQAKAEAAAADTARSEENQS